VEGVKGEERVGAAERTTDLTVANMVTVIEGALEGQPDMERAGVFVNDSGGLMQNVGVFVNDFRRAADRHGWGKGRECSTTLSSGRAVLVPPQGGGYQTRGRREQRRWCSGWGAERTT